MTVQLPELEDDGLITPQIGAWGEEKYRLVSTYAGIFATSMKRKWECRVYIDLFAGSGRSSIRGTKRIVPASPLLALNLPDRFDKYVFCDINEVKIEALKQRVSRDYPEANVEYVSGDANDSMTKILDKIPKHRVGFRVLAFCFVDPFRLENLAFDTIRKLAIRYMDFLVLIPSGMDANRNESRYTAAKNKTVDRFLGTPTWRGDWRTARSNRQSFGDFLTDAFGKQMTQLSYIYNGIENSELIRLTTKNVPLYRLSFFSRHKLGDLFWKETRKYSKPQLDLPWPENN
jgi:three-Cys-motif partner protein